MSLSRWVSGTLGWHWGTASGGRSVNDHLGIGSALGHWVGTGALGHLVTRSFSNPVAYSSGHWTIGSLGHGVTGPLGQRGRWVIGSLGHWVTRSALYQTKACKSAAKIHVDKVLRRTSSCQKKEKEIGRLEEEEE